MINRVVLVGRMTKDPELRRTANGIAVTSFTLALNRNFNSADGQQADYIPCVVWNKVAENVERYCSKGSLVGVEGHLQSRTYDNAQGQKVFVIEAVCNSVQFIDTRDNTNELNKDAVHQKAKEYNNRDIRLDEVESSLGFDISEDDIQF